MIVRMHMILGAFLLLTQPILAADILKIEAVSPRTVDKEIVPDARAMAKDGLPDGRVATISSQLDITEAWYSEPTRRYRHGVLGDEIEAGALKVKTALGRVVTYRLPASEVFEDITPRLADLDNDGTIEVITIRSSVTKGAAVTVYGLNGSVLVQKASTQFIGQSNRWLNIAAIANIAPDSNLEIAIVVKPHLSGDFLVIKYPSGQTVPNAFKQSFSNHFIGSRELRLSAVTDYNADGLQDVVLPSLDRRILNVIGFKNGAMRMLASGAFPNKIDKAISVEGYADAVNFTVGLSNGKVYKAGK